MKQELMVHYVNAVEAAHRIGRLCLNNSFNSEKKLYDTSMDRDEQCEFYRRFEDIIEAATEVNGNGRFFMCLIRTLEIIYIRDYYRPNAEGLDEFYRKQTGGTNIFNMPLDLLNLTKDLIHHNPSNNRQLEADILTIVLMA